MSKEYDVYLETHKNNVQRGYKWLRTNLPKLFARYPLDNASNILMHDESKSEQDEYEAYDAYFYGEKTSAVEKAFRQAWLLHIHRDPIIGSIGCLSTTIPVKARFVWRCHTIIFLK